jgi:hypothetical protein
MNRAFDYNGVQIAPSKPVQKLLKRTRILHIDSADRDVQIFPDNGSFTIYLPRAYERVASINIKSAEFPALGGATLWNTVTKTSTAISANVVYFLMEIKELNMSDETSLSANRSASTNSVFAKFVSGNNADPVIYNESSNAHQNIDFYPALTKLDRFQIKLRTHTMTSSEYLRWVSKNWSMTLEIETLENAFDEFSTIETRLGDRS